MTRNQELNQAGLSLFHAKSLTPSPEPDIWPPVPNAGHPEDMLGHALSHIESGGVSVVFCAPDRLPLLRAGVDATLRAVECRPASATADAELAHAVAARLFIRFVNESHPFAGSAFAPDHVRYFFDPSAVQSILAAHIERWRSA